MKVIPFVFVIGVIVLLSCVGQEPVQPGTTGLVYFSITDKQLDMANVSSVDITISKIELHKTGAESIKCALSLCGCKCYPEGQTPEEVNGTLCGINCLGEFNVTGCKVVDNACKEVYAGENDSANVEESAWVAVLNESKTYDLMQLTGIEELVSSADLGTGSYNIIRLQISEVKVTLNGIEQTAKLPSGKIDINIAFATTANKSSIVKLDFNLNDSLHITGDGQIIMAPVIKVEVSGDVELNITDGKINRIRAEKEAENEVGMDENGSVGEGKRIRPELNLTIGDDGKIKAQEREQGGQQGQPHTPQQYDVSARITGFTPDPITIRLGDTIRWIFRDDFSHRLVSDDLGFDSMGRYLDSVWTYKPTTVGTFAYRDSANSRAQGTIIVNP